MPFVDSAGEFFKEDSDAPKIKKSKEVANTLFDSFYKEKFHSRNIRPALLFLKRLSRDFGLSLRSRETIEKVRQIADERNLSLESFSGALYGLCECGFSASHFSADDAEFFVNSALDKIDRRDSKFSKDSQSLLTQTIAVFSSLKNLGLLENCSVATKSRIESRLARIAVSPDLDLLRPNTKSSLWDFSLYCREVVKIDVPDFAKIRKSLPPPKEDPSPVQFDVFEAIKKYLANGLPAYIGADYDWHYPADLDLPPSELEKTRFEIGDFVIAFESRVVNDRRCADIVITDNSVDPPSYLVVEVDGEHHLCEIDGAYVPSGKTCARNKMLEAETGSLPVIIGPENFCKFFKLKDGVIFCNSIPALRAVREKIAQGRQDERSADPETTDVKLSGNPRLDVVSQVKDEAVLEKKKRAISPNFAVGAAAAAAVHDEKAKPKSEPKKSAVAVESVKKSKSKKKVGKKSDDVLEMLESHEELEALEEFLRGKKAPIAITQEIMDFIMEERDIKALILLKRYAQEGNNPERKLWINSDNPGLLFIVNNILFPNDIVDRDPSTGAHAKHLVMNPTLAKLQRKLQQRRVKAVVELKQQLEGQRADIDAQKKDLSIEESEFLEFLHQFYEGGDPKNTIKEVLRKGELWKIRIAFLSKGFASKCEEVIRELVIVEKAYLDLEVVELLFSEFATVGRISEMQNCYIAICNYAFLQGDVEYLTLAIDQRKKFGLEISSATKDLLMRNAILFGDNPEIIKALMEDEGRHFSGRRDELVSICNACKNSRPGVLEFVLGQVVKIDGCIGRIQTMRDGGKSLFTLATHDPNIVRILFDYGIQIEAEDSYEVFSNAFKLGHLDSLSLILARYPKLLDAKLKERLFEDLPKGVDLATLSDMAVEVLSNALSDAPASSATNPPASQAIIDSGLSASEDGSSRSHSSSESSSVDDSLDGEDPVDDESKAFPSSTTGVRNASKTKKGLGTVKVVVS